MDFKQWERHLEILQTAFKERVFAGPNKVPAIPELIEKEESEEQLFFLIFLYGKYFKKKVNMSRC